MKLLKIKDIAIEIEKEFASTDEKEESVRSCFENFDILKVVKKRVRRLEILKLL